MHFIIPIDMIDNNIIEFEDVLCRYFTKKRVLNV